MKITLRNFLKKNFFFITITILNLYIFNLFLNIFIISKNDYETRLINNGGYCEKGGYGFIKFVKEKYTISNNIRIENFNNFPAYESLFHKIGHSYDNGIILIGAESKKLDHYKNDYLIIENMKDCYFLKKND
jgi:hypothetical protein